VRLGAGPPTTSIELDGWGDGIVHDYLRGMEHCDRLGALCNKDYGCEWDYDWRNERFQRQDNTIFAVNPVVYAMTSLQANCRHCQPWQAAACQAHRRADQNSTVHRGV
jgi:hypothetical protein